MDEILIIAYFVIAPFLGGYIANRKGRKYRRWFFIILLTFTIALYILAFLSPIL